MKYIEIKENETVTISLERFYSLLDEVDFINEIENEISRNNSMLTKEQAEELLDRIRTRDSITFYMEEDPHRVRIIENGEKDG